MCSDKAQVWEASQEIRDSYPAALAIYQPQPLRTPNEIRGDNRPFGTGRSRRLRKSSRSPSARPSPAASTRPTSLGKVRHRIIDHH